MINICIAQDAQCRCSKPTYKSSRWCVDHVPHAIRNYLAYKLNERRLTARIGGELVRMIHKGLVGAETIEPWSRTKTQTIRNLLEAVYQTRKYTSRIFYAGLSGSDPVVIRHKEIIWGCAKTIEVIDTVLSNKKIKNSSPPIYKIANPLFLTYTPLVDEQKRAAPNQHDEDENGDGDEELEDSCTEECVVASPKKERESEEDIDHWLEEMNHEKETHCSCPHHAPTMCELSGCKIMYRLLSWIQFPSDAEVVHFYFNFQPHEQYYNGGRRWSLDFHPFHTITIRKKSNPGSLPLTQFFLPLKIQHHMNKTAALIAAMHELQEQDAVDDDQCDDHDEDNDDDDDESDVIYEEIEDNFTDLLDNWSDAMMRPHADKEEKEKENQNKIVWPREVYHHLVMLDDFALQLMRRVDPFQRFQSSVLFRNIFWLLLYRISYLIVSCKHRGLIDSFRNCPSPRIHPSSPLHESLDSNSNFNSKHLQLQKSSSN